MINVQWISMRLKKRVPFNMKFPYQRWSNSHFVLGCDLPITMATIRYLRTRVSVVIDEMKKKNINTKFYLYIHLKSFQSTSVNENILSLEIRKKPLAFIYSG